MKILTQFVRRPVNVLWRVWGYPTVVLFATQLNVRIPQFLSPLPDPEAIATDVFLTFGTTWICMPSLLSFSSVGPSTS